MANEIQVQIQMGCANGDFYMPPLGRPQSIDQAVAGGGAPGEVVVGTAEVDVDLSAFTTPGYAYLRNMGETGTGTTTPVVTYGPKSAGSMVGFGELKEGEEACLRLTSSSPTLRLVGNEHDIRVQIVILED
jgi:hypothetical protein